MNELTFSFDSYELPDPKTLLFHYSYRDAAHNVVAGFVERYVLPGVVNPEDAGLQRILQQLHIIVGISYYKSLLGPVELPYALNADEAEYWNTVYDNGLGEYAYLNKLTEPIRPFAAAPQSPDTKPLALPHHQGAVLGIGGGKDSIVGGEILKGIGLDTLTMDMATGDNHGQAGMVMDAMGLPQLRVERYLDTAIIGFTDVHHGKNGHIPLSAILAWLGVLLAYLNSKKYIVMANESAASVGNVTWNGREVNHQWSKSLQFEKLTQDFIREHLSPDLYYFSPIRPYGSLAVMALFTKLGVAYFGDFTSCNLVLRIDPERRPNGRWCTHCAKCLSSWLLLSRTLPREDLVKIFGRDLFEDTSLQPLLHELLGLQGHKPLDCVGTTEELRAVTRTALQMYPQALLFDTLSAEAIPGPDAESLIQAVGDNNLPAELRDNIKNFVTVSLAA